MSPIRGFYYIFSVFSWQRRIITSPSDLAQEKKIRLHPNRLTYCSCSEPKK